MTPNLSDWIRRAWFLFRFRKKNGLIGKGKVETFRRTSRVPRWTPATVISSTDLEEEEVAPIDRRRTCNKKEPTKRETGYLDSFCLLPVANTKTPQPLLNPPISNGGVSLGFPGLLYCWAYKRYCVTDKDHGLGTSDDHFIINITELASVNPSILIRSIPIRSIPIVDFNPRKFEDCVECVLCLSDLADGDKAKLLPSCKHWFHAHCIDAWLESQATCPICKTRVRLFQTNEPSSGNLICCDEHSADMTAVVVDI
ncbi:unnamed protein product, partial [Brassica oleracea]